MKVVGSLLALIGCLFLLLAGWYGVEATRFFLNSESANGEVVEHEFTGGLNTGIREVGIGEYGTKVTDMYAPVVMFSMPDGKEVRFRANWSEGEPPPIGTGVGVRYPRESPEKARITGVSSLYGGAGILLLIGGIFTGAGLLTLRKGMIRAT
jgi:hypothetical protein